MIKVIDDGIEITLQGNQSNPLFLFSLLLVAMAMVTAVIAMTLPVKVTIGALFVLAVFIFMFNIYKNHHGKRSYFATGRLVLKERHFLIGAHSVKLTQHAELLLIDGGLVIKDAGRVWHFSGFETDKESQIAKSVLEGKRLEKKACAIRLAEP